MSRTMILLTCVMCACGPDREQPPAAGAAELPADTAPAGAQARAVGDVGFASPETVLWDSVADVYLVSNINGKPGAEDNNGFISRLRPDGTVSELKWIEGGQGGVTLHGPKGMLFSGDTLWVADVGGVRLFERGTGRPLGSRPVATTGLNDLALGPDGSIYATDLEPPPGGAPNPPPPAIYRITEHGGEPVARGDQLQQPDGLLTDSAGFLLAPFGASELLRVDSTGRQQVVARLPGGKLDGLYPLPGGGWAVTSWDARGVYRVAPDGTVTPLVQDIESPAQLGFDAARKLLLIPSFNGNAVHIRPLRE